MTINGVPQADLVVINAFEYMQYILDYIDSEDFKRHLNCDEYGNNPIYKAGFMAGMNWAALLTSQCKKYLHLAPIEDEEEEDK